MLNGTVSNIISNLYSSSANQDNLQQINKLTIMVDQQQIESTNFNNNGVNSDAGGNDKTQFNDICIDLGSDEDNRPLNGKEQLHKQPKSSVEHHLTKYRMRVALPEQVPQLNSCDSHIDISLSLNCILKSPNYGPVMLAATSMNNNNNNSSSDDTIEAVLSSSPAYSVPRQTRLLSIAATNAHIERSSTPVRPRSRSNSARIYEQLLLNQADSSRDMSASQPVSFCENNLLSKYNLVLRLIGWRPFISSVTKSELYCCAQLFNHLYALMIVCFLFVGYVLQYASCFRQDNIRAYVVLSDAGHENDDHTFSDFLDNDRIFAKSVVNDPFNDTWNTGQHPPVTNDAVNNLTALLSKGIDQLLKLFTDNVHDPGHAHRKYQCTGGFSSYYFIPSVLHIVSFITMMTQMRIPEADRFHNLCVQSYIILSQVSGLDKARQKLRQSICQWLLVGLVCLLITLVTHMLHIFILDEICFTFLHPTDERYLLAMKVVSLLLFTLIDLACIAIIVTYSLHCQLNIVFLNTNETAMREKRINFGTFTKNTEECKISIDFLNSSISLGVSILLIHFASRLIVAMIDMVGKQSDNHHQYSSTILALLSVLFWALMVITPLVQAARVSEACASIKHIGHELRARPFCYQTEPYADLDSLLSYTSTLNLNARILTISVRSSCIATIILLFIFSFLILGQVNVINI